MTVPFARPQILVGMPIMHDDWNACQQEACRSSRVPVLLKLQNFITLRKSLAPLLILAWACCWPVLTYGQEGSLEANLGEEAPIADVKPNADPGPAADPTDPGPATDADSELTADEAAKSKKYLIPTNPIELFFAGGIAMWPLLGASMISLWFVLERIVILRRRRVIPRAFVDRFIQHLEQGKLNAETALRLCEENESPIADVFAHAVRKWGKTSVEVEQAVIDGGERQIAKLRTHLRVIHGVYTLAPLLGLAGTVVGMIASFNELAMGGDADRMQRLASGVGVALVATASGLFVAIPSFIFYMYLSGRVDGLVIEMDTLAQKVVNLISSEALASRSRSGSTKANPSMVPATSGLPSSKPRPVGT